MRSITFCAIVSLGFEVRMEPTWMIMAHAAGSAAAMATATAVAVQDVNVQDLQALLVKQRQMIHPCCPPSLL